MFVYVLKRHNEGCLRLKKTLNKKWVAHQTEDVGTGTQLDMELEKKRPRESEKTNWFQSGHMWPKSDIKKYIQSFLKATIWNKGEDGPHL